jgi:16S rRNA (cytosine1402-N4)-methyltransferase
METNQHIPHIPVMLTEILEYIRSTRHGVILVDCTLGYGGHSQALCEQFNETDLLIGLDKDEQAIESCRETFRYVEYPVRLVHQGFENLALLFEENDLEDADYYLFDCGFSSVQVDLAERGFSFMRDGVLDMRMDQRQPLSAKEIVASWSEEQLANAFKQYGDERFSRRIAKAIIRRRKSHAIDTTQELADIVVDAIPAKYKHQEGIHPATRVFQALRIVVNDELEALRRGLQAALDHLRPGGRIGVLSYHSLEHRIVKELFRSYCGRCICPPGLPQCGCGAEAKGTIITRRPVKPCAAETDRNPRARSAQLRVLERFGLENE